MSENLILWGVGTSRTVRAHWAMHELGLKYECRPILPRSGETKTPDFTKLNPRQKIPLLQDGSFTIGESAAIVTYLSRTYSSPDSSLVPDNPAEFARWLEWCFFIVSELDSTSLYVMRRHGTNQGLAHIYGAAPGVVEKAGEYFRQQLRHVEVSLDDGRRYLMGDRFTSADILLTTCLVWAKEYGVGVCDNAVPYLERVTSRPAYQKSQAVNAVKI
jgi:glutathione S-transferase